MSGDADAALVLGFTLIILGALVPFAFVLVRFRSRIETFLRGRIKACGNLPQWVDLYFVTFAFSITVFIVIVIILIAEEFENHKDPWTVLVSTAVAAFLVALASLFPQCKLRDPASRGDGDTDDFSGESADADNRHSDPAVADKVVPGEEALPTYEEIVEEDAKITPPVRDDGVSEETGRRPSAVPSHSSQTIHM